MPLLTEQAVLKFFHLALKNRVCREIFHCIKYIFYHLEFLSNLPLLRKTEFALKFCTLLGITLDSGFLSNLGFPWKTVCLEFTVVNIYFLSFRIFEQLVLALKNRVALKIFTALKHFLTLRIFEQLAFVLKTESALNSLYWIYIFYHSRFLSNLRLLWKESFPWNFSRRGSGRPSRPPPRTPMIVYQYLVSNPV